MGFDAAFSRALGKAGFLGLTLPKQYGGQERSAFSRFVVAEELLAVGAPVAAHWITDRQSTQQILHYGTEAQRQAYLPGICKGELYFCIGMSEPGAGSDLASVRTHARRDGESWILNGQKIWTTIALHARYMIALVRTSGSSSDRKAGLSQVIIDMEAPGVTVRPIVDLSGDPHFAEVFFDDVRLPPDALLGAEGGGWDQVISELAFERSGPERIYTSAVLIDAWITRLRKAAVHDQAALRLAGSLLGQMATLRAMSISVTAHLAAGRSPVVEASLLKDLGTTFEQSVPALIADDLASRPDLPPDPELARTLAYVTAMAPSYSLRGGTREILRGIIARGLGLR